MIKWDALFLFLLLLLPADLNVFSKERQDENCKMSVRARRAGLIGSMGYELILDCRARIACKAINAMTDE